jgi:hypothetical protein
MKKKAPIKNKSVKENAFIQEADIICTTLSTGANKVLAQLTN